MQRKVSKRVQKIHCQLTDPAIAGRLKRDCTPRRSDFTAGMCVQNS